MTIPIVVVDDEEVDRYIVQRAIKALKLDAKLVEYEDGLKFVEVIRDFARLAAEIGQPPPPALVLLDINMPRMGGFEVLEKVQELFDQEELPIFVTMYSSSDHAEDRADAKRYPFVHDYIVKPVTKEKLQSLVEKLYPST